MKVATLQNSVQIDYGQLQDIKPFFVFHLWQKMIKNNTTFKEVFLSICVILEYRGHLNFEK